MHPSTFSRSFTHLVLCLLQLSYRITSALDILPFLIICNIFYLDSRVSYNHARPDFHDV